MLSKSALQKMVRQYVHEIIAESNQPHNQSVNEINGETDETGKAIAAVGAPGSMARFASKYPSIIAQMRDWAKDCQWADLNGEELDELDPAQIAMGVERYYEGGIQAFLRDANINIHQMELPIKSGNAPKIKEASQVEPYDPETDTYQPSPRERTQLTPIHGFPHAVIEQDGLVINGVKKFVVYSRKTADALKLGMGDSEEEAWENAKQNAAQMLSKNLKYVNENREHPLIKIIRESVKEVLQSRLCEDHNNADQKKMKSAIYSLLDKANFHVQGNQPNEYWEDYRYNFATVYCQVDMQNEVVNIQRYYDNERIDSAPGKHIEKSIPLPKVYSQDFVDKIVKVCLQLQHTIHGDAPLFAGVDDVDEAFDPTSVGPNPAASEGTVHDPYKDWNKKMRTMEENEHGRYAQDAGAIDMSLNEENVELIPTGHDDDWSRPVYRDASGKIYVDVNCGNGSPAPHTISSEGEPEFPLKNFTIKKDVVPDKIKNALCPRCKNSKPEWIKNLNGKLSCDLCHWGENEREPRTPRARELFKV